MNMDDLYRLLRTGHVQAQGIVDTVSDPLLVLDQSLTVVSASRSFFKTFQVDRFETVGRPIYELGNGQWEIPALRLLLSEVISKATAVINYEVEHDFPHLGKRTMLVSARTLHNPDHNSQLMLLSIVDATDAIRRESAKDMLFAELRHRMKNLLAVTQSIARQTATKGRTAEQFRDDFLGRFTALAAAEDVAFSDEKHGSLQALVERVMSPYDTGPSRVVVEPGPPLQLGYQALQSLGLVLHELATNATKYGALSTPEGRVTVSWRLDDDKTNLRMTWVEAGGPPTTAPSHEGFGSKLIQSAIAYTLRGKVEHRFSEGGLETEILFPL